MGLLAVVILSCLIFVLGIWIRRRREQPSDHIYSLKLAGIAVGGASLFVGVLFPYFYVLLSRTMYGGTIASNMPPGASEDIFFGIATLGAGTMLIGVVYTFLEHVKS